MTRLKTIFLPVLLFAMACTGDSIGKPSQNGPDGPGSGGTALPEGTVSITDFRAAVAGGDWHKAFTEAFRVADRILVPDGEYPLSPLMVPSGKTIEGAGAGTVFTPLGSILFRVEGSAGDEIPVVSHIPDFSSAIEVASVREFAPGDLVILKSQRNCMFREDAGDWTLGQTTKNSRTCFFGELLTVHSAAGNTVTTEEATLFPFYRSDASQETVKAGFEMRAGSTLQRIDAVRDTHLKNFTIRVSRACSEIVRIKWAENCTVEQVTFRVSAVPDDSFMVLKIYLARNCKAVGCRSEYSSALIADLQKRMTKNYDCYSTYNNFRIISSQECVLENCTDNFASHAFNITYSSGGIPSIRCKIRNCRAVNSVWAGVIAQQCTPWSELAGNTVERSGQGVLAGCRGSKIMNNTVSTHLPFSTDYYYTRIARGGSVGVAVFEGYARDCEIRGNRVENFYTGIAVLDGYEELNVFDRVDAVIADNTVRNCIHGFYHYRNSYNTARGAMHVTLSGNVLNGAGQRIGRGQTMGTLRYSPFGLLRGVRYPLQCDRWVPLRRCFGSYARLHDTRCQPFFQRPLRDFSRRSVGHGRNRGYSLARQRQHFFFDPDSASGAGSGVRKKLLIMKRFIISVLLLAAAETLCAQRVVLSDYAANKSGDDWAGAFAAAFAEGDFVYVPEGEYRCSEVRVPGGKTIAGAGNATRFQPLGKVLFCVEGVVEEERLLAEDMADFSRTMRLVSADGLLPGDDLLLIGQRNSMMREDCGPEWTLGRTYKKTCPFGEFLTVETVEGCIVTTTTATLFPFYYKDASRETIPEEYPIKRRHTTVQRLRMVKDSHLRNFTVVNTADCTGAISFRYAEQCSARNIRVEIPVVADNYCPFSINWSKYVSCLGCSTMFDEELAALLKPIAAEGFKAYSRYNLFCIFASFGCGFEQCESDFSTHAFNITAGRVGHIPCVGCYVRNCRASNAVWAGVIVQQACCNSLLEGNKVSGSAQGVVSGGRNTVIRNNEVYCDLPFETNYYYAHAKRGGTSGVGLFEGYAGGSVIENNVITGARTGILIIDGYEQNNIFIEGDIVIRGNRTHECLNGFFLYKNKYNRDLNRLNILLEENSFIRDSGTTARIGGHDSSSYGIRLFPRTCGVTLRGNAVSGCKYGMFVSSPAEEIVVEGMSFRIQLTEFHVNATSIHKLGFSLKTIRLSMLKLRKKSGDGNK